MSKPSILFYRPGSWHSSIASSTKVLCRLFHEHGYPSGYFGVHADIISLLRHPVRQARLWQHEIAGQSDPALLKAASLFPMRDAFPWNTTRGIQLAYRTSLMSIDKPAADPAIIWAARPGASALKKRYPKARLVMQVVDYYPAFRGEAIRNIERQDYALADHIVLIGEALKTYLVHELNVAEQKITVLGQGVDCSTFSTPLARPADFPQRAGPVAVWVGVLAKADPILLRAAAKQLQTRGGSLLLIGPDSGIGQSLANEYSCVHVLGSRHPNEVPAYLVNSDIGLMLYNRSRADIYRGQNPLKLYEYAAAGLTILSTPHNEYEYLKPPIKICTSTDEVAQAVQHFQPCDETRAQVQQFALHHDWQSVFWQARQIIDQLATTEVRRYDEQASTLG